MTKKTKIVSTLGPASSAEASMRALVEAGVDVFRLNTSHGDFDEHAGRLKTIRSIEASTGRHIGALIDLAGPKIRTGDFEGGSTTLVPGERFILTRKPVAGDSHRASISYKRLPDEVSKGDIIALDDGRRSLVVDAVRGDDIICTVKTGGLIRSRRGVSVSNGRLSIDPLTPKDKKNIDLALAYPVDYVALSFVRRASDIQRLRALMAKKGIRAQIIAKIETAEAAQELPGIVDAADGLMVARGDLAVTLSPEEVPLIQKNAINLANRAGKPVITATQMLDSMTRASVPTRAEVSDIANAILDGTDALMLSEETAVGEYPVEAVKVMSRVAARVEGDYLHRTIHSGRRGGSVGVVTDAVTSSAVLTAEALGAVAIVALTTTGRTARMLSRHKPIQPIVALSPNDEACRRMKLSFGVSPFKINPPKEFADVLLMVKKLFLQQKLGKKGDRVVIVCGLPFGKAIDTNLVLTEVL